MLNSRSAVLRGVLQVGAAQALRLAHTLMEPEHILLGILKLDDQGVRRAILSQVPSGQSSAEAEIDDVVEAFVCTGTAMRPLRGRLRTFIHPIYPRTPNMGTSSTGSPQSQELIRQACQRTSDDRVLRISHVLATLISNTSPVLANFFRKYPDDHAALIQVLVKLEASSDAGGTTRWTSAEEEPFSLTTGRTDRIQRRLRTLYTICEAIIRVTLDDDMLTRIAHHIIEGVDDVTQCALILTDPKGMMYVRAVWPSGLVHWSRRLSEQVCTERRALIWSAKSSDGRPLTTPALSVRAAAYLPLIHAGKVFGVLYICSSERTSVFDEDDIELLRAVAAQSAIAIHNQALRREQEQRTLVRNNLQRYFAFSLVDRIIERYVAPNEPLPLATVAVVLSVRLEAPKDSSGEERIKGRHDLGFALADALLTSGAAFNRGAYNDDFLAVLGAIEPDPNALRLALHAADVLLYYSLPVGWSLSVGIEYGKVTQRLFTRTDPYSPYVHGLRMARSLLGTTHLDFLTLEQRLTENLSKTRKFGDQEQLRHERNVICNELNYLLIQNSMPSFNKLCHATEAEPSMTPSIEYSVAGNAVDRALELARFATPGQILLGEAAWDRIPSDYHAVPWPDHQAYIVVRPKLS